MSVKLEKLLEIARLNAGRTITDEEIGEQARQAGYRYSIPFFIRARVWGFEGSPIGEDKIEHYSLAKKGDNYEWVCAVKTRFGWA